MSAGNVDSHSSDATFEALTDLPFFLGYMSSYLLQGILFVQLFIYYVTFPKDARYIKIVVWATFFLECITSVLATVAALWSLVGQGYFFTVSSLPLFRAMAPLCGVVTLIVHCFYAWRIHVLRGPLMIPFIIFALTIAQCIAVIISGTKLLGVGMDSYSHPQDLWPNIVWLGGSAICDFIIATSLIHLLRRATSHLPRARTRLQTVMLVAVETGTITAFGALIELAFFIAFRNSFIHYIMFFMLPKLYANCMMATLNSRSLNPSYRPLSLRESNVEWASPSPGGGIVFSISHAIEQSYSSQTLAVLTRNRTSYSSRYGYSDMKDLEKDTISPSIPERALSARSFLPEIRTLSTFTLEKLQKLEGPTATLTPAAF